MKAIDFNEANINIAENQPECTSIPAYVTGENSEVTMCFELDEAEREQVAKTGRIWLSFLTFGNPFQPIWGSCLRPEKLTEPVIAGRPTIPSKKGPGLIVEHKNGKRGRTYYSDEHVNGKVIVYFETEPNSLECSSIGKLCSLDNLTQIGFID